MLKRLFYICVVLLLFACRHNSYSPKLLEADSLCCVLPDSALTLLQQLSSRMPTAPEPDRMFYQLLCIKAADKATRNARIYTCSMRVTQIASPINWHSMRRIEKCISFR